ncbi:MAG: LysR substrate-binding domain-containing protein [Hyphomonas sp.]
MRHLRAFVKTYELGTILAASKAVHISQPAVTQGLARLEDQLNAALFVRQSDGMHPTLAADALHPRARIALELIRSNRVSQTQIRAFTALAREGSYVEASARTGLARASLHRAVSDLEAALGQKLVRRRGRGIELTAIGQAAARRYRLALAELSSASDEIRSIRGEASGRISIGAMPLCRARVLPASIVRFQKDHPRSEISVAEGSHVELIEPLRDGELDFLIGALRDPAPGPDLVQTPLFSDQPVILARSGHPLGACATSANFDDLIRYDWCIPQEGVPLRDRWQAMFAEAGLTIPKVRVECGSVIAIRQILMNTDCLTILSPDQVAVELEAGWLKIVGLAPQGLTRTIGLTQRANWRPTPMQAAFLSTLKKVCVGTP